MVKTVMYYQNNEHFFGIVAATDTLDYGIKADTEDKIFRTRTINENASKHNKKLKTYTTHKKFYFKNCNQNNGDSSVTSNAKEPFDNEDSEDDYLSI